MKIATIVMSIAAIAAVFAACGGARDRGPNHNDVSATETPANPASTPVNTEPGSSDEKEVATTSTLPSDPKSSWTDGPGSPGARSEGGPNTNHTNTVTAHAGGTELTRPQP